MERVTDEQLLRRYLDRYRNMLLRRTHLIVKLNDIKEDFNTSAFHAISQNGGGGGGGRSTVPIYILQVGEIEERIQEQIENAAEALEEIEYIIDLLPEGSIEQSVLSMKYVSRMNELDICDMIPCSRMSYYRFTRRGIERLLEMENVRSIIADYRKKIEG